MHLVNKNYLLQFNYLKFTVHLKTYFIFIFWTRTAWKIRFKHVKKLTRFLLLLFILLRLNENRSWIFLLFYVPRFHFVCVCLCMWFIHIACPRDSGWVSQCYLNMIHELVSRTVGSNFLWVENKFFTAILISYNLLFSSLVWILALVSQLHCISDPTKENLKYYFRRKYIL